MRLPDTRGTLYERGEMKALGLLALVQAHEEVQAVKPDGGEAALVSGFHTRWGYLFKVPVIGTVSYDSSNGLFDSISSTFDVAFEEWWWRARDRFSCVRCL